MKYVVIEMQNGNAEGRTWNYDTREDAEVKYYSTLAEMIKSEVERHSCVLMTDEGFVLEKKFCDHSGAAPEPAEAE